MTVDKLMSMTSAQAPMPFQGPGLRWCHVCIHLQGSLIGGPQLCSPQPKLNSAGICPKPLLLIAPFCEPSTPARSYLLSILTSGSACSYSLTSTIY